jgi:NADH dehydrogenase (ubiquinone) 1 beta subcomplex subunit 8
MASLRSAIRLAPRAQFARTTPALRVTQRRLASTAARPATDDKPASQVEQASEDLSDDPNMVRMFLPWEEEAAAE